MPEKAIKMLKKIFYIALVLFLAYGFGYSEQGRVKIILENGYYCTQLESGEKFQIVRQWEPQAPNKIVLSPDEKYVAYTTNNFLGFESQGRDVYYCKIDGSERTFLHKFAFVLDTLLWGTFGERDFIFVISMSCSPVDGGIQVIDVKSKDIIISCLGSGMKNINGSDCYQIFCYSEPVQKGRQKICLEELLDIEVFVSSNVLFHTGWGVSDIYISTQREPVLKLSDLPKLAKDLGKNFKDFLKNRYFHISETEIVFSAQYNIIAFIGAGEESLSLTGVYDLWEKKLLLFDYSDSLRYASPTWSPDGSLLALLKRSSFGEHIDFYKLRGEGKIDLIKTFEVMAEMPISGFRWSDDSETFYFSYFNLRNQKIEKAIALSK